MGILVLLIFVLSRALGDPTRLLVPLDATPQQVQQASKNLGLDRSYFEQLYLFLSTLVKGDLGVSFRSNQPVWDLITERLPSTVVLTGLSLLLSFVASIPLGIAAALNRGRAVDSFLQVGAVLGFAMPTFWLALLLVQLFSVRLGLLPVTGFGLDSRLILPVSTLSLAMVAALMRLMRSTMLEVLSEEYIQTARGKGLGELRVVAIHALRNALIPVVTFGGVLLTQLLTGAVVVEVIFAWPGIGRLAVDAISVRDFPLMQGIVIVVGLIVVGVNLLIDVIYGFLDPKIRVS